MYFLTQFLFIIRIVSKKPSFNVGMHFHDQHNMEGSVEATVPFPKEYLS